MRSTLFLLIPFLLFSCQSMEPSTATEKVCGILLDLNSKNVSVANNWKLLGIGKDLSSVECFPEEMSLVQLDLRADGQVRGTSTCNSFSGLYESKDNAFKFRELGFTEKLCGDTESSVMTWENRLIRSLDATESYELLNNCLRLKTNNGADLFLLLESD